MAEAYTPDNQGDQSAAPAVAITSPADQTTVQTGQAIEIDWSITNYQQGQEVSLTAGGDDSLSIAAQDAGGETGQLSITPGAAGSLTLTVNVLGADGTQLAESPAITLTVEAPAAQDQNQDASGSPAPAAAPTIAITAPADQTTAIAGQTLEIDWAISNFSPDDQVSLTADPSDLSLDAHPAVAASGSMSIVPTAAGNLTLTVNVLGADGTPIASPSITLTVQPAVPGTPKFCGKSTASDDSGQGTGDSIQVASGTPVVLIWEADDGATVELTDPAAPGPQTFDASTTTATVTPVAMDVDYLLVALNDSGRSQPATVHVSTHDAGDVVSGHATVTPDGDEDAEGRRYDWVQSVITSQPVLQYKQNKKQLGTARFDTQPWKMNVLGLRGWIDGKGVQPQTRDVFRDTFYVAYIDDNGKKCCEAFLASTDPGINELDRLSKTKAGVVLGNSHILPNQYRFRRAQHKGNNGSCQAEPFFWWNDTADQHNTQLPTDKVNSAILGIDNHASVSKIKVGYASLGCQVVRGTWKDPEVQRYFYLMSKDPSGIYKYTLVDTTTLDGDAGKFAALSPSYAETAARTPLMTDPHDSSWVQVKWTTDTFFDNSSEPGAGDAQTVSSPTGAPQAPANAPAPSPAPAPASTPASTPDQSTADATPAAANAVVTSSKITVDGLGFVDWFHKKLRPLHSDFFLPKIHDKTLWSTIFDDIPTLTGKQALTLNEFLVCNFVVYKETGWASLPVAEDDRFSSSDPHEGDAHFFGYNRALHLGNNLAGDQLASDKMKVLDPVADKAWVKKWNQQGKSKYPSSAPDAQKTAAHNCDFAKLRGRGLCQVTGRTNYELCVNPELPSGKTIDDYSDDDLTDLFKDATFCAKVFKRYFDKIADAVAAVNQDTPDWHAVGIAVNGEGPNGEAYATELTKQCNAVLDAFKKAKVVYG